MSLNRLCDFEVAAGSVQGRAHALAGRPNQDAFLVREARGSLVAVVADGCGSAEQSEVGAWIGAGVLATEASRAKGRDLDEPAFWEAVQSRALDALRATAASMGGDLAETVRRFFLFTVVGAVLTEGRAAVFSLGDGLIALNGEVTRLGPFPGNAPPYLGHALLGGAPERITVHRVMAERDVESIVIATDGAAEWSDVADRQMPGTREEAGPLAGLWQDDRLFHHPDALRRKLSRMNRQVLRPQWEARRLEKDPALLEDDTTIIVIRARRSAARAAA